MPMLYIFPMCVSKVIEVFEKCISVLIIKFVIFCYTY